MNKKSKILTFCGSLGLVAVLTLTALYFIIDFKPKGHHIIDEWNSNDEYSEKYVVTLEKDSNKSFTILNLADIQLSDFEPRGTFKTLKKMINELIERTHPDLITLTGDQIWTEHSKYAFRREVKWFEGFKVPWAPVFGNHDKEGSATLDWQSDKLEKADYCLYKRGPSNIGGIGNYVLNIKENGKVYKSLYMLDLGNVDDFSDEKVDFIKWHAFANKDYNGRIFPESLCFFHKGIDAFNYALQSYKADNSIAIGDFYLQNYIADKGCGENFFEAAKEINVTDIICGHQHENLFTIPYEGIRLSFGLKTGDMCSVYIDQNNPHTFICGGTSITFNGDDVIYKTNYVGEEYRIKSK